MDDLDSGLKTSVTGPSPEEASPPVPGDFYRTGLIEYGVANEIEAGYCGKFLFLFDGQTCPLHHHRTKLETFSIQRGVGPALILEVSKPCVIADNYFANPLIPIGGNYRRR